jgi:hypothetical protein
VHYQYPKIPNKATLAKTQSNAWKIDKYCTNCEMTNHIVETCKKMKEQTIVAIIEATQPSQKTKKTFVYACRIYGLNGHKMTNFPNFVEMQKMFHGKYVTKVEV